MRRASLLIASLLLLTTASGSLVEDTTGGLVTYQFDGDGHQDAPDDCASFDPAIALPLGNRTDGVLLPVEDEADHFVLAIEPTVVGERVLVDAILAEVPYDVRIDVFVPGCLGSVLDPENQPAPPIQDPVPGDGEQSVQAKNVDGAYACSDRWFWNLNQVKDTTVPDFIHVTWTDGSQEDVPVQKTTPATVVHYTTTAHPDATVERATAIMDGEWGGQFILSEGFCDATDGGAVFGDEARRHGDTSLEFTPVTSGLHVVSVTLVTNDPTPGTTVPVNCHYCVSGLDSTTDPVSYDLGSLLS